jgi:lipopolysaccharide transport protein LptA/LPS export ABC transporter protein LptC
MADESREIRKNRAIRRLRWVTLFATLVAVVLVVALFLKNRREAPATVEAEPEAARMEPTGDLVTVGEGFERTFSEGDREVFTVRGDRYGVDRKNVAYLEGVEVIVYREDGSEYVIEAKTARFDIDEREGRLEGGVRVAAPDGMELTTAHLLITRGGQQIRSDAPVELRIGDSYRGEADGLQALLGPRRFVLLGVVKVVSLPGAAEPMRLDAQGLVLDRTRKLVHARNKAVLRRRGERISALSMDVFFAEDEATVRFIRAVDQVRGFLRSGPGGSLDDLESPDGPAGGDDPGPEIRRLAFRGGRLTMLLTEDGRFPKKLDLERSARGQATIRTFGPPEAPRYRLAAPAITAWFTEGQPERAEATGGVLLVMDEPQGAGDEAEAQEAAAGARQATARTAEARFDDTGELTTVVLEQDVVLTDGTVEATGERGVFQVEQDAGELTGRPAVATSERGRMEAPRILYTRDAGLVHGTGGVRARLDRAESSALSGSPLGRGDGPVWIEAEEGDFRNQPREFHFVRDVRAWRGEDLLVADELRGDEAGDRLTATGSVRTFWTPAEDDDGAGKAGAATAQAPLEVEAHRLVYSSSGRTLVYTGDVVAVQEKRTVACSEMVVELAPEGGIERLVCTGDVRVEDPEQGKSLQGARAVYDPGARTVEVLAAEGGKVTMKDRDGNVVEGPRMIYDIDSDRVRVVGRGGEAPAATPPPGTGTEPPPGTPPPVPGPGAP